MSDQPHAVAPHYLVGRRIHGAGCVDPEHLEQGVFLLLNGGEKVTIAPVVREGKVSLTLTLESVT